MARLIFPKTLGATSDALYKLKLEKAEANKKLDAIEEKRIELTKHAFKLLREAKSLGSKGKVGQISITEVDIPTVEDWDKFMKYLVRTKGFDMVQRRLSQTAIKERWADKKDVPGVGKFTKTGLSITKVPVKKK